MEKYRLLKFLKGSKGVVLILFALFLPILTIMTGLVVDVGNWLYTKQVMQNAADAAVLGGAAAYVKANSATEAQNRAYVLYAQNIQQLNLQSSSLPTITFSAQGITLNASATVSTYCLGIINVASKTISTTATAAIGSTAKLKK